MLPIVIPELQLLEVQREELSGHAVMLYKPFLGETPEAFQAVYKHAFIKVPFAETAGGKKFRGSQCQC